MNIKRILSGILITCIVSTSFLSALPVSVQATTEGAHTQVAAEEQKNLQTAESPTKEFAINNKDDFSKFMTTREYWESDYKIKLNCDISWIFFKKFNPIEDFKGDFDGGGHTIKYVMLKCFVKNNHGTISRLNFQKSKLLSSTCGFVENNYGKITECTATGDVKGKVRVGGFVGINHADATINDCTATGNITGNSSNAGGFVGDNYGTITNCTATGNVKGNGGLGGFVGYNYKGTITGCTATGDVSGICRVGGFAGDNFYGTITNCTATGLVKGHEDLGGFVGDNRGSIKDSSATGNVKGDNCRAGGFVGSNKSGRITNCIATGNVNGYGKIGGFVGYNFGRNWNEKITNCIAKGNVKGDYCIGGFVGFNSIGTITNCTAIGNVDGKNIGLDSFAGKNEGKIEDCKID